MAVLRKSLSSLRSDSARASLVVLPSSSSWYLRALPVTLSQICRCYQGFMNLGSLNIMVTHASMLGHCKADAAGQSSASSCEGESTMGVCTKQPNWSMKKRFKSILWPSKKSPMVFSLEEIHTGQHLYKAHILESTFCTQYHKYSYLRVWVTLQVPELQCRWPNWEERIPFDTARSEDVPLNSFE